MDYFSFQWHITEACDQRCSHCYIYAHNSRARVCEMDFEAMKQVILRCMDFCKKAGRLPYFYITGGDPILHPDFWKLLELLKKEGIPSAILGNPFHLTEKNCRKMAGCGVRKYQISLDGLQATHDQIRQPGSFQAGIQAIERIRKAGMEAAIMATVSRINVHEIPALMDEAVRAHADIFAFARYCPGRDDTDVCCSAEEYRNLLDLCFEKMMEYKKQGCQTWFCLKDHLWILYLYEKGLFHPEDYPDDGYVYEGCSLACSHMTILSDGSVYACRRMESKVGNVFEDDLYDLFTSRAFDDFRIYENFEKCSKCELLRFCRGCPAVSAGYSGSMYAADPQCWKTVD